MNPVNLDANALAQVVGILQRSPLFSALPVETVSMVAQRARCLDVVPGEVITREGEPADSFFVILNGEAVVSVKTGEQDSVEVGRMTAPESLGEVGLMLEQQRTATVTAVDRVLLAQFDRASFILLFEKIPGFGFAVCRGLANRLQQASKRKGPSESRPKPPREVLELLPVEFMQRYRVMPLSVAGQVLTLGCVDAPNPKVILNARPMVPGMDIRPERVEGEFFDEVMREFQASAEFGGAGGAASGGVPVDAPMQRNNPRLDAMLKRMVAEGASDLHLSGGQRPRWRVDGLVQEITGANVLGHREVWDLFEPVLEARHRTQFEEDNDTDFAYAIPGVARFRCNLFRDHGGVGGVMRQIPSKVLTFEQLGLPPSISTMCTQPKGLVLVTGPTGSGKSTTLAAMIDYINRNRQTHILTMEDPIEFLHVSQKALVNQREVGSHTKSFHRALKAALREDPDIILVGEMRDKETVQLALETANTGHLVFGTLHTSTAIGTMDRIVDMFPSDQQGQIRSGLADTLRGVVAQTLCRKTGGGRVAALEVLVSNFAVANLIREGKTTQLASHMSTNKAQGNQVLNEHLAALVASRKVEFEEALSKTLDRPDLARRLNRDLPREPGMPAPAPVQPAGPPR